MFWSAAAGCFLLRTGELNSISFWTKTSLCLLPSSPFSFPSSPFSLLHSTFAILPYPFSFLFPLFSPFFSFYFILSPLSRFLISNVFLLILFFLLFSFHFPMFWIQIRRIRKFLGLPDPSIIKQKYLNLDFYSLVTSLWIFIFENDVNVPFKK